MNVKMWNSNSKSNNNSITVDIPSEQQTHFPWIKLNFEIIATIRTKYFI